MWGDGAGKSARHSGRAYSAPPKLGSTWDKILVLDDVNFEVISFFKFSFLVFIFRQTYIAFAS